MGLNADEKITEGVNAPTFVPSLPIPNVQELVRKDPLHIPERYVRSQEEMVIVKDVSSHSSAIPVMNLSLISDGNKEELSKLDVACKDWGFFQLVNHGVPTQVLETMKDAAAKFFELPLEEKSKYSVTSHDIQGYGHAYVVSSEQILDWYDALLLVVYPKQYRKLEFWPEGFKDTIEAYSSELKRVAEALLGSLSLIMGMQKDTLLGLHKELVQGLRVNYYPPCSMPDQVLGLSPHSDTSTITLLMQEDNVSGLEIQHKAEWVPVKPIPNALVVNVGDVMEIWSNGKYKSVEHRAVINKNKARISHALFFFPRDDVDVKPFDHMIDAQRPKMYNTVRYGEYLRQSMSRKMEGKAHTDVAMIET
ncbi:2-oxoglutarate (2OG) and Fe(II)-dependent oxygenase superfamily protein [Quillaja saponaria]|uniref:2-oxoglutarate (2OG) and Fe(II)-dependent oxygenase superfamily protein n=1 Tax=Quillaja saponaria TaxID=32244 RepID=A0AAD7L3N1_QUISA|nr:2-oxoglutarate (2OG) and Fe(II)-dependent oxygenase superfamily protein [Quillaja saponaria]